MVSHLMTSATVGTSRPMRFVGCVYVYRELKKREYSQTRLTYQTLGGGAAVGLCKIVTSTSMQAKSQPSTLQALPI